MANFNITTTKEFPSLYDLMGAQKDWESEWINMPEYHNKKIDEPEITCKFKFRNTEDFEFFKKKIREILYNGERFIDGNQTKNHYQSWYPLIEKSRKFAYQGKLKPRFPIYIVSKGRYKKNPTSKILEKMGIAYHVIVEKTEYNKYAKIIDKKKLLILPQKYKQKRQGQKPQNH